MYRYVVLLLVLLAGACTAGTAEPTTSTPGTPAASTTLPPFDPDGWVLANLLEVRAEGMAGSQHFSMGAGFGVPISEDGLVLTTASAVLGANRINVFTPGREFPEQASLEAVAECLDLALIDVGVALPNVVSFGGAASEAWQVTLSETAPISELVGSPGRSPRLLIDGSGAVAGIDGLAGRIPVDRIVDEVSLMRRREQVSQLGFLAASLPDGLAVVSIDRSGTGPLQIGDLITDIGGTVPTLDTVCGPGDVSDSPLRLTREDRHWTGSLSSDELVLASARTVDQIRSATVRLDVDADGDSESDRSGSGFFVSQDGLIVTNHHVVAGVPADGSVEVVFDRAFDRIQATIVGRSSCADLAVLRVGGSGHTYLEWSPDSPVLDVSIRSVGYPAGTDQLTIKRGIVSKEIGTAILFTPIIPTFEHSAEVIPGSSGGPVVNDDGEVVGIVFGGRTLHGITEELAISGPAASEVVDLLASGDHSNLGLSLGIADWGIYVDAVDPGSIAASAGLQKWDRFVEIDGTAVDASSFGVAFLCDRALSGAALPLVVGRWVDGGEVLFDGAINGRALERVPEPFLVRDPSGILSTFAPGRWDDYQGIEPDADSDFRGFRASPDVDAFLHDGFGAHPGMRVMVSWQEGLARSPRQRLEATNWQQCADAGITSVVEREYEGFVRRWTECQGTDSVLLDYALTDTFQNPLMVIITIIAPAGEIDQVADLVLSNWAVDLLPLPTEDP